MLAGSCLCEAVGYLVPDEFRYALICHCSQCRRTTGSAYKPFAGIEHSKFQISRGQTSLVLYGEERGHNAFCKQCGSLLYSLVRDGAFVHVTLGTLVDEPSIRPTAHIFVGSKASWEQIADDLPKHDEMPVR